MLACESRATSTDATIHVESGRGAAAIEAAHIREALGGADGPDDRRVELWTRDAKRVLELSLRYSIDRKSDKRLAIVVGGAAREADAQSDESCGALDQHLTTWSSSRRQRNANRHQKAVTCRHFPKWAKLFGAQT
jgi:hypothetical protein